MKNNGTSNFTLKHGNATTEGLTTPCSGPLPNGYSPMRLDPSILLGTGGDNSPYGIGKFFEGAVTSGYPSDATENAVQAAITAAGYSSSGGGGVQQNVEIVGGRSGKCVEVPNSSTSNGTRAIIWDCNGQTNQQWNVNADGTITGVHSGLCLD
ncbi:MAG: non-reducing end alpha-L-arabinofuranosidase, partial [Actinomycetota bacterium]|nr:non-reducing end alpha-L-arabinofuranosidase [Actinomycetota bacterium]